MQRMVKVGRLHNRDSRSENFVVEAGHLLSHAGVDMGPHVSPLRGISLKARRLVFVGDSPFAEQLRRPLFFQTNHIGQEIFCVFL